MFRNKALPPSHGVGIWIEAFGFVHPPSQHIGPPFEQRLVRVGAAHPEAEPAVSGEQVADRLEDIDTRRRLGFAIGLCLFDQRTDLGRSEEHTSELQSLMRISYAVFCLKKKNNTNTKKNESNTI